MTARPRAHPGNAWTLLATAALVVSPPAVSVSPVALPGAGGAIGFDDLRFSPELRRVIVPGGRAGKVYLLDPDNRAIEDIAGFSASGEARRGHGESATSADTGGGLVFASDRTRRALIRLGDPHLVRAIDPAHGGAVVGVGAVGEGVDAIAYGPGLAHVYVPAADAAALTVLGVDDRGAPHVLGTIATARGAHCVTADDVGNVYVCDPARGRLLEFHDPYPPSR